jgi:hypothetical protein
MKRSDCNRERQMNSTRSSEHEDCLSRMQSAETLEEINQKTLTIRDQFAIAALQGFMANKNRPTQFNPNDDAAKVTAHRLLSNTKVLNYLDAMGSHALESVGESLTSRVEWWKRAASTAEELLEPYCQRVIVPGEDDTEAKHLWVNSTDDIPSHLQQYVVCYKRYMLGGYILVTRELFDPKTRAKASEQLDKITGNSIDRVELSGVVGNVVQSVPEGATIDDIAQLYQKALK